MNNWLGCGVADHSSDCLCDVEIGAPTPTNFSLTEVMMGTKTGGEIAELLGLGRPWNAANVASLMEAMGSAYETVTRMRDFDPDYDVPPFRLRGMVAEQLQAGHSILDLPDILGTSFAQILSALTGGHPSNIWTWDDLDWLRFEAYLHDHEYVRPSDLVNEFGIATRQTAIGLMERYGKPDFNKARDAVLCQLVADNPQATTTELVVMAADAGFPVSREAIWGRRRKERLVS